MRKTFVVDTSVLLFDPQAIYKFGNNDLVIPLIVVEQLDHFKRDSNENGRNARYFSNLLDSFRAKGHLAKGVKLNGEGGKILVDLGLEELEGLPPHLRFGNRADNLILACALRRAQEKKGEIVLVTKDTNLRVKADVLGVSATDFEPNKTPVDELYTGISEYTVPGEVIDTFFREKKLKIEDIDLNPNEFIVLKDEGSESHTAIARYDHRKQIIVPLRQGVEGSWGVTPKNVEQTFAMELLLNDDIQLVTLVGKAGTGKTLLALAAGLKRTIDDNLYQRMLVSRPIFPMGKDIGFLPGDVEQKLNPWMQPIFDNMEFLMSQGMRPKKGRGRNYLELINQGMINIEPLTYIRGRSIPNQYLIVDEAQNLTPHEIKTIITRAGENTKVVLTGDLYQIDNPYIDSSNAGLAYIVDRFKEEPIAGHVTLRKGERSGLAELATNLL
ncbi:PhoH family protein [Bdellovibrionota bacterium]